MFEKGDIVEILGLKSKPEWNGKPAKISNNFNWDKGRYPISIIINDSANEALLKPSNMKLISKNLNTDQPFPESKEQKDDERILFDLILTKQKGIGMFARCDIKSGTIILNDKPLLHLARNTFESKDDKMKKECIMDQYKLLSKANKQKVLDYHNNIQINENDIDVLGIYFTNAYTIIDDEADIESAFFPNIARMNHSCFSNCEVLKFDIHTKSRSIIALFDIKKGDELTIYYIGNTYYTLGMIQKVRKEYILSQFNFECACNCCVNYDRQIENYRKQYGKLQDIIDENVNNFAKKSFKAVLSASEQMIKVVKDGFNKYPTILSQCYINAAHALLFLNEYDKCIKYVKKSVEIDQKYYKNKAIFDDVEEILAKLPNKYYQKYPWHHVLNLHI